MQIPQLAIDMLSKFEGCKLQPYWDMAGYPTIGIGHLLSRKKWEDLDHYASISLEEAEGLLQEDLQVTSIGVLHLTYIPLNTNQLSAVLSFAYNLGTSAYNSSMLRAKINSNEMLEVPREFLKWCYAGGKRSNSLLNRRKQEAAIFAGSSLL